MTVERTEEFPLPSEREIPEMRRLVAERALGTMREFPGAIRGYHAANSNVQNIAASAIMMWGSDKSTIEGQTEDPSSGRLFVASKLITMGIVLDPEVEPSRKDRALVDEWSFEAVTLAMNTISSAMRDPKIEQMPAVRYVFDFLDGRALDAETIEEALEPKDIFEDREIAQDFMELFKERFNTHLLREQVVRPKQLRRTTFAAIEVWTNPTAAREALNKRSELEGWQAQLPTIFQVVARVDANRRKIDFPENFMEHVMAVLPEICAEFGIDFDQYNMIERRLELS